LINSLDTPNFKQSSSIRVPPPNGLLYPDNFKKRKTLARVFVKSRRQKPTYYESLTPSYKPVGFRSGYNIDLIKHKVKPVATFVDDEFIPGVKIAKPPEVHHSPQHHPRRSAR